MGGEGEREGWVLRRGEGEIDDGTGGRDGVRWSKRREVWRWGRGRGGRKDVKQG